MHEDNRGLEEERAELLVLQTNTPLSIEQVGRLHRIQMLLSQQTADLRKNIQSAIEPRAAGLRGSTLQFHSSITDKERAMQSLARINLPEIQDTLTKITGYTPVNMPQTTTLHSATDLRVAQAAIVAKGYTSLTHDPRSKRLHFRFKGLTAIDAIDGNINFIEAEPEEARGVYFHELGHVWTSRMYALDEGRSETYVEAFGEIFRSAAALYEGADWQQATGCRGYEILSGAELPNLVIPHWQNLHIPTPLFNAGRFVACNRIIEHLGGLNERTLHGLSKACDVGTLPYQGDGFADVLRAIERETGVKDFAKNVLHDPTLQCGGMKPGPVAVGLPAANNNGYRIECFTITDPDTTWGTSKQLFNDMPERIDVNSSTFDFRGVRIQPTPFALKMHNEDHDVDMSTTVTSGEILLNPEQILDLALMGNTGWPGGKTSILVSVSDQPFQKINTSISISEEFRSAYQRKKGVQFRR